MITLFVTETLYIDVLLMISKVVVVGVFLQIMRVLFSFPKIILFIKY